MHSDYKFYSFVGNNSTILVFVSMSMKESARDHVANSSMIEFKTGRLICPLYEI